MNFLQLKLPCKIMDTKKKSYLICAGKKKKADSERGKKEDRFDIVVKTLLPVLTFLEQLPVLTYRK